MNYKFILNPKANSSGENPIYLRVTHNYRKTFIKTTLKILPKYWNKSTGKAKTTNAFPLGSEINLKLSDIESVSINMYNRYLSENKAHPDLIEIKKIIENEIFGSGKKNDTDWNVLSYYKVFLTEIKEKLNSDTGRPISDGYINTHKQTFNKLTDFYKKSKHSKDFEAVNIDFYEDFISYLNKFDYTANYIGKHIKNIKTILNKATIKGVNKTLYFKAFKEIKEDTFKLALNESELKELYSLEISNSFKQKVRDVFIFAAWTGLRFSDLKSLNEKAQIDNDCIVIKAQKTQKRVSIPLLPISKEILEKYNYKIPSFSEPTYNKYIKQIGKNIPSLTKTFTDERTKGGKLIKETKYKWEMITSHTARRSFATNMFKRDFNVFAIMAITGHKNQATFFKYVQLPEDYHAKNISERFKNEFK